MKAPVMALIAGALVPLLGGCDGFFGTDSPQPVLESFPTTPAAGNPDGTYPVPVEGQAADVTNPDHVIGDGTPESCTAAALAGALRDGGVITFACGDEPTVISLTEPLRIYNATENGFPITTVVIDGGGTVALSGGDATRILYMNTCDQDLTWTTPHCDNQDQPDVTIQNLTFMNGNSTGDTEHPGGGAIWARGGRLRIISCRFFHNVSGDIGPDVGGGAVRAFDQYNDQPLYVVGSTFGGQDGKGNRASNGGALSSIGVSWTIINSVLSYNEAIGNGGNPAQTGTPGGGSGGAIYNDGNTMTLQILDSIIEENNVNAYGAAVFFVSNNHDGTLIVRDSTIHHNDGGSWHELPGISMHDDTHVEVTNSTIED